MISILMKPDSSKRKNIPNRVCKKKNDLRRANHHVCRVEFPLYKKKNIHILITHT